VADGEALHLRRDARDIEPLFEVVFGQRELTPVTLAGLIFPLQEPDALTYVRDRAGAYGVYYRNGRVELFGALPAGIKELD
jgi:hypothetical protein